MLVDIPETGDIPRKDWIYKDAHSRSIDVFSSSHSIHIVYLHYLLRVSKKATGRITIQPVPTSDLAIVYSVIN